MTEIYDLRTEYMRCPNAVDSKTPRFSWKIQSTLRNVVQKSYHITACTDHQIIWDSGIVNCDECRFIHYAGDPLKSRQKVNWQVSLSVEYQEEQTNSVKSMTLQSKTAYFQMGLLQEADWKGRWITADVSEEGKNAVLPVRKPASCLRKTFTVREDLKEARIYETAHGLYESFVNGQATDEDKFKPGLTSYYYRIQYQTYDITASLREGVNVWSVVLADGWWRGTTGGSVKNNFGYSLDYLGQIELLYEDGSSEIIGTDETFRVSTGGLLASDMLMGDIYDAGKELSGWKLAGFNDHSWRRVRLTEEIAENPLTAGLTAEKIAARSVPVREMESFHGRVFLDASGRRVIDFGQNIAGYVKMTLHHTKAGQKIVVTHGETLDWNGNFTVSNVNKTGLPVQAFQQVTYICRGAETETYQPSFSIFGFRYLLVEGYDSEIHPGDFTAKAVYSAMEETGKFSCSNPLINQLVKNSLWSQKSNFMDVPVDCPTRERNAWTGDAQVFVRTACTFMNAYSFYEKWLQDLSLEQYASGKIGITFPSTSSVHNPEEVKNMKAMNPLCEIAGPEGNGNPGEDSAGWGDAAAWIPYSLYLYYGDPQILSNQYETAKKWLEYELSCAREENPTYAELPQYHNCTDGYRDADFIFDTRFHYGEWNEAFGIREKVEKFYAERKQEKDRYNTAGMRPSAKPVQEILEEMQKKSRAVNYYISMRSKKGDPVVATAYMARTAGNVADMADILGKTEEAGHYRKIAERIRKTYDQYLIGRDGVIEEGHQAPYVRVLEMNLCGEEKRPLVIRQLLKEVQKADYSLNTGFLSTPFLLPVLCDCGYSEEAYRILENENLPGWLYPIRKGMTTIPESWGGVDLLEDSLNHYSYGAVCEFLFQYTAGIRPCMEGAGYKHFILKPVIGGSLTNAKAEIDTPFGKITSEWNLKGKVLQYHCIVPANTSAEICLPGREPVNVGSGEWSFCV